MIAFKVAVVLSIQLIISTYALPAKNVISNERKAFTLEDLTSDDFISEQFNGTWISDNEIFYRNKDRLLKLNIITKTKEVIAKNDIFENSDKCYPSPDGNYVLLSNKTEQIFRHSTLSVYSIYSVKSNTITKLANGQLLSTAFWAPQGNSLAYVLNNDIYYHQVNGDSSLTRRITSNGEIPIIYNGVPDWVYEEEVYSSSRAMWFSPSGKHLVFVTFNDTEVREAIILRYGKAGSLDDQYPTEFKFRYPKVGASNPNVTLNLVDLTNSKHSVISLKAPIDIVGTDHIIFMANWLDSKTVVATWTNRVQNLSQMVTYSLDGESQYLLKQQSPGGWLIKPGQIPFYYDGYVILMKPQPVKNASLGLFSHVTRYTLVNGVLKDEIDLTPGGYWVHEITDLNSNKSVVTFVASPPGKHGQKRLYEVNIYGGQDPTVIEPPVRCVSCNNYKSPEGNECKYVSSVSFSTNHSHYVLTCDGPDPTTIEVYGVQNDRKLYNWSRNEKVRQILAKRTYPQTIDMYVESHGFDSKVRVSLPADFDENKKYPAMINVYAGPESYQIRDSIKVGFNTYMTTNKQVIQILIDGRGSPSRGTAMLYAVYRNLGDAEVDDQITVTKKLQDQFPWIDRNRTGIWGWSYGGYATARALVKDKDNVFKCGMSVAPVTNWIYYDSIYTERYMGLPTSDDNLAGYESSSVLDRVEKLRGKKFMLIHGTADDNVHFQQSMALNKALAEADILYDQLSYPDEDHSLRHVTKHLYHAMDRFWDECFKTE